MIPTSSALKDNPQHVRFSIDQNCRFGSGCAYIQMNQPQKNIMQWKNSLNISKLFWKKKLPVSKLDGVAPLIAVPPPDNSTTMHSWLVCQGRHFCLGGIAYLPGLAKQSLLLNQWCNYKFNQDLEFSKPVKYIFYETLWYILPFGLGGAVNTSEEEH